jgi:hypothetical protein
MAWLTVANDDNKVVDHVQLVKESMTIVAGGTNTLTRTITYTQYRHVGMEYDSAVSAAETLNEVAGTMATVQRENEAGAYMVQVTTVSASGWE